MTAGEHRVVWDGRSETGRPLASGAYFYEIIASGARQSRKLLILR